MVTVVSVCDLVDKRVGVVTNEKVVVCFDFAEVRTDA
jgi:hypothetical protein